MQTILVSNERRLIALRLSIVSVNTNYRRLSCSDSLGGQIEVETFHVGRTK